VAQAVVGIGSNLGDRLGALRRAAARVSAVTPLLGRSRIYESAAVGGPPQGDFLNAAVAVDWNASARQLLEVLLSIERELGRVRGETTVRWGPRSIDLDLLWMEGIVVDEPGLSVPHPRLAERPFALAPLLDVVPSACEPATGRRYTLSENDRRALRLCADEL
jgi:2-amino-4-hydroxy-6-hydroxymethyldihydropteridine diphosphokinase